MCNTTDRPACPKCRYESGNDWSQCSGRCPLSISPHHNQEESELYQTTSPVIPSSLTSAQKQESRDFMTREKLALAQATQDDIPY